MDIAGWLKGVVPLTRNPLGIIAIFISLVYGMDAILLAFGTRLLPEWQTGLLTVFVCLFPFVILWVFYLLVTDHSTKLYAPADFRSDAAYAAVHQISQSRDTDDVEAALAELGQEGADNQASSATVETIGHVAEGTRASNPKLELQERAYFAESLVLDRLQALHGSKFKRQVQVKVAKGQSKIVDGLLDQQDKITLVEVKYVRSPEMMRHMPAKWLGELRDFVAPLNAEDVGPKWCAELVLVIDIDPEHMPVVPSWIEELDPTLPDVREVDYSIEHFSDLLKESGFDVGS